MSPFTESELANLRTRFPLRDVDRLAGQCATKHAKSPFRSPLAMLTKWLETSEKNDSDRLDAITVSAAPPPGMFRADGSWDPSGYGDPVMHRFVDMLVTARRREYSAARIAGRIMQRSDWQVAFPNAQAWLAAEAWSPLPASTSAERCVIDAGQGAAYQADGERSDSTYAAFRFAGGLGSLLDAEIADLRGRGGRW